MKTDHRVHQCLKEEFNQATIIHKLHIEFRLSPTLTKILVMDKEKIIKFGSS